MKSDGSFHRRVEPHACASDRGIFTDKLLFSAFFAGVPSSIFDRKYSDIPLVTWLAETERCLLYQLTYQARLNPRPRKFIFHLYLDYEDAQPMAFTLDAVSLTSVTMFLHELSYTRAPPTSAPNSQAMGCSEFCYLSSRRISWVIWTGCSHCHTDKSDWSISSGWRTVGNRYHFRLASKPCVLPTWDH